MTSITMTRFRNANGPLTKLICLDVSGGLRSDSSGCVMSRGTAQRTQIPDLEHLAQLIHSLNSDEAIALGSLRAGLPHKVGIATKRAINGASQPGLIARTAENIVFKSGHPGFALLDFDTKGMPADVAERLAQAGGFWPALLSVMPMLDGVARIRRASTSAGLFRQDTGQPVPGSNGVHVYLEVEDAADGGRFLKALHDRCWLARLGWLMVGVGGQLLERSIVDRMVGSPERLVFEGPPSQPRLAVLLLALCRGLQDRPLARQ
jgi:hypothetical protein